MAHHIYHTRGIILGSSPRGESNRLYRIFTEELGLIIATAQAVREGKSKLRYVLQDFSIVHVDLVRGKDIWRITSALEDQTQDFVGGEAARKLFVRICNFTDRFLQGEGRENSVFTDLYALVNFLKGNKISDELLVAAEIIADARLLFLLGYVDGVGYEKYLLHGQYSMELLVQLMKEQPAVLALIDKAVTSSHL